MGIFANIHLNVMRDNRVHQILEGTNEIMRVIVARAILRPGGAEDIR